MTTSTTTLNEVRQDNPECLLCSSTFNFSLFRETVGRSPEDGDLVMCINCGEIHRVSQDNTVTIAPPEFIAVYAMTYGEVMDQLLKRQQNIKAEYNKKLITSLAIQPKNTQRN
jgi:hypothetical protein